VPSWRSRVLPDRRDTAPHLRRARLDQFPGRDGRAAPRAWCGRRSARGPSRAAADPPRGAPSARARGGRGRHHGDHRATPRPRGRRRPAREHRRREPDQPGYDLCDARRGRAHLLVAGLVGLRLPAGDRRVRGNDRPHGPGRRTALSRQAHALPLGGRGRGADQRRAPAAPVAGVPAHLGAGRRPPRGARAREALSLRGGDGGERHHRPHPRGLRHRVQPRGRARARVAAGGGGRTGPPHLLRRRDEPGDSRRRRPQGACGRGDARLRGPHASA